MRTHVARLTLVLGGVVAAAFTIGCGSSNSPSAPSTSTVNFSTQVQQQIFNPACVACHTDDGRTPAGAPPGLNLKNAGVSISNLVNAAATGKAGAVRVIPGNPNGSYLIQKLEGAADIAGVRMPRNANPLTNEQIALIKQWIQEGAKP